MQRIGIVGLGLLGASIAYALLGKRAESVRVFAFDTNPETRRIASNKGIVVAGSLQELCEQDLDMLILAVPMATMERLLTAQSDLLSLARIVTDVGSVKSSIVSLVSGNSKLRSRFVPGHPMAGTEHSGIEAAQAHLFENQTVILTPNEHTEQHAMTSVVALWRSLGATVQHMDAILHDQVLAYASHLPHLLSFGFMNVATHNRNKDDIFHYGASGFRDFTRIAASDTTMWSDIVESNKNNIAKALGDYIDRLQQMQRLIEQDNTSQLQRQFAEARDARHHFSSLYAMKHNTQYKDALYAHPSSKPMTGSMTVPGDKSMSHRAVIFGAIADGTTTIHHSLMGEDNIRTQEAFRAMGVSIETAGDTLVIHGVGKHGLREPDNVLYMGNSGTAMRLLGGLLAAQSFPTTLTGDDSLNKRPMKRIINPLTTMGARVSGTDSGTPPLTIVPSDIQAIDYQLPVASAQVKSAVLLAGLYADAPTTIREEAISRDHTERMLAAFGADVTMSQEGKMRISCVQPPASLTGCEIRIPGDFSSATFFIVATLIQPESHLTLTHIGINESRIGALHILREMGADIEIHNQQLCGGEPVADISVRASALHAIDIPVEYVPLAIDEFPALFIAAALAEGTTRLRGAEELRVKESDRLSAMAEGLSKLGIAVELFEDGIAITGQNHFSGGEVDSSHDHRIAMSFAIASLRSQGSITILNAHNIVTSFPQFVTLANAHGCILQHRE